MRRITPKLLSAAVLTFLAAFAVPMTSSAQTGKVYHYVQSLTDGSEPTDVWVYFEKDRIEQFSLLRGSRYASLSVQSLQGTGFAPGPLDVWDVSPREKILVARVEPTGAEQARVQVFSTGRPAEMVARPAAPWAFYTSLPVLTPLFRQKTDPKASFEVSLATPYFAPGQAPVRFDGPFTVSFVGEEERGGVRTRKHRIFRSQDEVGFVWVGPEGDLREAEVLRPARDEEDEAQKIVFRLEGVEPSGRAGWEKLRTARLGAAPDDGPVEAKTVAPHPCRVPGLDEEVRCATYAVWEDREGKKGRKIGLNVVILPAVGKERVADPIFFFAGGPGEGIAESAPWLDRDNSLRRTRDAVLIDQRGTGRSNRLQCHLYGEPLDYRKAAGDVYPADAVRKCRAQLEKVADLRFYTTALAADDFDEVRAWLGYDKINLWGGSYGTRMAQVYLRRHPETVRSVVLVAVAPVSMPIPLRHAYAGMRAIEALLSECRADAACNAAFPDVRREIDAVLARVEKGETVMVTDTRTGERVQVRPSRGLLAEGVRYLMYGRGGGSLPLQIHRAYQGDLTPLVQMSIENRVGIHESLAMGLNFSVTCAEDLPYITDEMTKRETAGTLLRDYRIAAQKAVCEVWPRGAAPADVHEPVRSEVPVLLISGEWDPVTPPEFAEEVARTLPNSLHVVVPRGSHGGAGRCTDDLVQAFYDRASVQGLDASCVKDYAKPVFMLK
ncbi:MAG TPA: alpha/beta hydrolase [Thermoanaerobaculia bacterium]